jgi:hypothetical protein
MSCSPVLTSPLSYAKQEGLLPGADAPVWPMDAFRDRFLTAFGPEPTQP